MTLRSNLARLRREMSSLRPPPPGRGFPDPATLTDDEIDALIAELTGTTSAFIAGLSDDALEAKIAVLKAERGGAPPPDLSHLSADERAFVLSRIAGPERR
jgi:hypothetical protein